MLVLKAFVVFLSVLRGFHGESRWKRLDKDRSGRIMYGCVDACIYIYILIHYMIYIHLFIIYDIHIHIVY